MPVDYKNYVGWWKQFSEFVRFVRAENVCECTGECGTNHKGRCRAENGVFGKMGRNGIWYSTDDIHGLQSDYGFANFPDFDFIGSKVCLTVAHLDREDDICDCRQFHDFKCAKSDHCKAMCNFCHLKYDRDTHRQARAHTLSKRKDESRGLLNL